MVAEIEHATIGALPRARRPGETLRHARRGSDAAAAARRAHRTPFLHDLGFSDDAIADLRRQKVI